RRAEEAGPPAVQFQEQAREEPGAVVVQPLLAKAPGLDVAVGVEDSERIPVLEHPGPLVGGTGRGEDVVGATRRLRPWCAPRPAGVRFGHEAVLAWAKGLAITGPPSLRRSSCSLPARGS